MLMSCCLIIVLSIVLGTFLPLLLSNKFMFIDLQKEGVADDNAYADASYCDRLMETGAGPGV